MPACTATHSMLTGQAAWTILSPPTSNPCCPLQVHNKQYDDTAFAAGAGTLPGHRQRSEAVGEAVPPLHAALTSDEASSMLDPVGGVVEAEVEAAPRVPTFVDVGGARRWSVLEPFDPRSAGASTGELKGLAEVSGEYLKLPVLPRKHAEELLSGGAKPQHSPPRQRRWREAL